MYKQVLMYSSVTYTEYNTGLMCIHTLHILMLFISIFQLFYHLLPFFISLLLSAVGSWTPWSEGWAGESPHCVRLRIRVVIRITCELQPFFFLFYFFTFSLFSLNIKGASRWNTAWSSRRERITWIAGDSGLQGHTICPKTWIVINKMQRN